MHYEVTLTGDEWVVWKEGVEVARYPGQRQALRHVQDRLSVHDAAAGVSLRLDFAGLQPGLASVGPPHGR